MSFNAASTGFLRAVLMRSMVGATVGITAWEPLRGMPPRSLELALALQVGKVECHLPSLPYTGRGGVAFPIIYLMWENVGLQGQLPMPS